MNCTNRQPPNTESSDVCLANRILVLYLTFIYKYVLAIATVCHPSAYVGWVGGGGHSWSSSHQVIQIILTKRVDCARVASCVTGAFFHLQTFFLLSLQKSPSYKLLCSSLLESILNCIILD